MKHIQNTEAYNNEYQNMPSIDFRYVENYRDLITENQNEVDWNIVKSICEKRGFGFTIINGTFGKRSVYGKLGYSSEVVIYKKLDIDPKEYDRLEKDGDYDKIRELKGKYDYLMVKLHDCIHELDEETDLVFKTGWAGNYGLFSEYDFSYSFGNMLYSWRYIIDNWDPLIHDTYSKLEKGVYIFITSQWIKNCQKE